MKKNTFTRLLLVTIAWVNSFTAPAQISPTGLRAFISGNTHINKADVHEFYSLFTYQPIWLQSRNTTNRDIFLQDLNQAAGFGLREKDYQFDFIVSFRNKNFRLSDKYDSLEAEILLSDAALHFYRDIAYGNNRPSFGYDGLKYNPSCQNIPALMARYISSNSLQSLVTELSGKIPEIAAIEKKLSWYLKVISSPGFTEIKIIPDKPDNSNKPLLTKLYQLGIADAVDADLPDSVLRTKILEAQMQFSLHADGKAGSATLNELNVPISERIEQLCISLNYYRWLSCLVQDKSVIVVNIPAASLKVYRNNFVILEMRMIVGKKSTPTPTLTSTIDNVVLYPYWHVPYSIATKEILPVLKRNSGYINAGNYQVLNKSGNIVDPYSINWKALSRTNFPYIIRQSTGCDNALGLLKLNFNNPFSVYLHDTNNRNLFKNNRRYYSHGCMRMEKPVELGHLVLKNNAIAIDTLEQKGCLRNQSPVTVNADDHMPVVVWYNPAGIDSTGRVLFYEDAYKKLSGLKKD